MSSDSAASARADLARWAEDARENAADLAEVLGVDAADYAADPLVALPALEDYVSRLPLDEFESEDWFGLHGDLAVYLADVLVRRHDAEWQVVSDSEAPRGFRYLLFARALDGVVRGVDPYDVALDEIQHLPIEVIRMLAHAETALGLTKGRMDGE
ncbi:hypothetical protein ACIRRH_18010 [Kitasatospora sp. NPDC101235]|uniref:hypothetical protein n=1 Tax=Kitasatospora sp. NPDC101235 TaxID=3364101 RepID=UPI00382D17EE